MTATRLGDVLVAQGALSRSQLEQTLLNARGRIGDFLRAHGLVNGQRIATALATQHQLTTVDLLKHPPEKQLYTPRDIPYYIHYHYVPYLHRGRTLTLATSEPSEALREFAQAHYRMPVSFVITTPRDLAHYFTTRAATATTRGACHTLRRRYPHLVGDRILIKHQWHALLVMMGIIGAFILTAPAMAWYTLLLICNLFYFTTLALKLEFFRQGIASLPQQKATEAMLTKVASNLDEASLPVYSILVPLFRESSAVMAQLLSHLNALDYPKEKLDILLICEADDKPTLAALKALQPPETMRIVAVPPSSPRTKPKACNVALPHVRGEYVVIYDAEDAPAPDQLKRAVAMFQSVPENLACLQASLNYYNRRENTLTEMFSIEYSSLFRLLLPALERMGLPIPLGGTSNHLRTAALRDVGGWDAFNVTEDADLGIRLHYFGYETRTLPSLTLEESPISLRAWMKQRTRWIKGYIQTWLVYTRDPSELKRRLGRTGYYGFQFFVGAPALTFLLAPLFWAVFFLSLTGAFPVLMPAWVQWLCAASFIGGTLSHWLFARKVMEIEGWKLTRAFWLYPFYWLLHSLAAARALWQLLTAPHYWDKTRHGVSKVVG